MLTADEIGDLIRAGEIGWSGALRADALLLRLGGPLQPLRDPPAAQEVDVGDQDSIDRLYLPALPDWDSRCLRPGQLVLCGLDRPLRLGAGLAGAIGTLSHLARLGLAAHAGSPWVLPGWDGLLTLELLNLGPAPLRLHRGCPVARLLIFRTGPRTGPPPTAHPYYGRDGHHLGSRYAQEFGSRSYRR